jgi:hypothetical protein
MTPSQLLQRLPALREMFPTPIIQEWSLEEYRAGLRALDKRLLAALDRWREENDSVERIA